MTFIPQSGAAAVAVLIAVAVGPVAVLAQTTVPVETAVPAAVATPAAAPAPVMAPVVTRLTLGPEASAYKSALERAAAGLPAADREAVLGFYAGRDYAPFWTGGAGGPLDALAAALAGRPAHGLPAMAAPTPTGDDAADEIAAARAYLDHAGDLAAGILQPAAIDPEITITPDRPAPDRLLAGLDGGSVDAALVALEPRGPDYAALMAEKARLEALIGTDAWGGPVPEGPAIKPGASDPRLAALRARLDRLGYVAQSGPRLVVEGAPLAEGAPLTVAGVPAATYDLPLQDAVRAFQRDHGLADDGVIGRRTFAALNADPAARLAQVLVNLERLRWQDERAARRIEVNIPDYSVTLTDAGIAVWHTRAVVGEASKTRTPEFSDTMTYFVVNPTWHIPDSIATRVYLPKLKRDPSVLANSNMSLFTRSGVKINPRLVDFSHYGSTNFPFRVKQNPSTANALGKVKFMFPNQFAIYLHDTPARELFAKDARAFSNGCIRLEQPLELAYILLAGQVPDPAAAFEGWIAAKTERQVSLDRPIPVHIDYRTAFLDAGGVLRYRADVYGRDAKVFDALELEGVTIAAAQG